ncbi:MAG: outer membrane protein assembly factor BamC, partial [Gammaproteobacteria bacterium]
MTRTTLSCVLIAAVLASGCSKLVPKLDEVVVDNRREYRKAETLPDLEVPPDLSTEAIRDRMAIPDGGEAARYSTFQERRAERRRQDELERTASSAIRVLENEHVLAVAGAPIQVWPKLEAFWRDQGYALDLNDVELGIIETSWSGGEAEFKRDKFKVFAEPGEEPGTTVLYVSHEAQELVPQGEDLVWQRTPRDAALERRMVEALEAEVTGQAVAVATPAPAPAPAPAPGPTPAPLTDA